MKFCIAVIVTHNSEQRIATLLSALLSQTIELSKIIVVDNNSCDGTDQIINSFENNVVEFFKLDENLGGAGGFDLGLELASNHTPDYVLTFDDDAVPLHDDFIEELLNYASQNALDVVAPLVLNEDNLNETAYRYRVNKIFTNKTSLLQSSHCVKDIKLFNGVLFRGAVVDLCGTPNPKFFIRGDEEEYKQRILKRHFIVGVNTNAFVSHPLSSNEFVQWKGRRYHYISHGGKSYFSVRNRIYLLIKNADFSITRKCVLLAREFYRYTCFYLFYRRFDYLGLKVWINAFIDGVQGNFKGKNHLFYKGKFDA